MLLTFGAAALAHMALEEPLPRYPSTGSTANKACPCGVGESNRLCNVASDRSDPDRSVFISTYAPGETVTMRWRETIGHAGRWRVAFDADGADMGDFNGTILLDIVDPSGSGGNMGGNLWEVQVTLPTTPCDNCTLQLVQMMDGNMADPVPDPIGRSSYYQCVDIVITGDATDTDTPPDPTDTDVPDPEPPDTDVPDTDVPDTDLPVVEPPAVDRADAGCGCRSAPLEAVGFLGWFVGIVTLIGRRRSV